MIALIGGALCGLGLAGAVGVTVLATRWARRHHVHRRWVNRQFMAGYRAGYRAGHQCASRTVRTARSAEPEPALPVIRPRIPAGAARAPEPPAPAGPTPAAPGVAWSPAPA